MLFYLILRVSLFYYIKKIGFVESLRTTASAVAGQAPLPRICILLFSLWGCSSYFSVFPELFQPAGIEPLHYISAFISSLPNLVHWALGRKGLRSPVLYSQVR